MRGSPRMSGSVLIAGEMVAFLTSGNDACDDQQLSIAVLLYTTCIGRCADVNFNSFRTMLCISAAYAVMWCLSVCVCVCLSVTFVSVSKRTNMSSKFFHHLIVTPF